MHVFLDDYRSCPKGFVLATNAEECLLLLRDGEVDILSLDYELGPDSMNGGEVAAAIVREGLYPREIYLHTSSMYGKRQMYEMLYSNKPESVIIHNGPMTGEVMLRVAAEAEKL
ncbi:cyclic-phosphate processing receiver domain-containing protein [Paenibacillus sp. FSL R7-0272]|uniref:cyclic-phosphate processing receiver domain-containing protein n=1 Tax=Paenibacillus sp. FSL R7-0272 TaxID=2921679 RepID=UPI0030DA8117